MKQQRVVYIWLASNLVGMGAYLFLASVLWVRPEYQGTPGGPGDAFVWLLTIVPVLLLFATVNLAALVRVIIEYRRAKSLVPVLLWIIVCSVWLNVILLDHVKSVRYIDSKYAQPGAPMDTPTAVRP